MRIKELRLSKNLTQKEFANKIGVKRTTIAMWENEKSNPATQTLKKIAETFKCKIDDFI